MTAKSKLQQNIFATAIIIVLIFICGAQTACIGQSIGKVTGLKLPRFVSLKADKAHLRTGPGRRFPIEWVLIYQNMPLEVVDEYTNWRKIRDWEGSVGWLHRRLISGKRWIIVKEPTILYDDPTPGSPPLAKLTRKVIGTLEKCSGGWCKGVFSGVTGWVSQQKIWGVHKGPSLY
jgi:SH3-like domain-containing protein